MWFPACDIPSSWARRLERSQRKLPVIWTKFPSRYMENEVILDASSGMSF